MIYKKTLASLLFILGATTLTIAMVKEQSSHDPHTYLQVTTAMSAPVRGHHTAEVDDIFTKMKIRPEMHKSLTHEERKQLARELSQLYARNMALIGQFERKGHETPHADPKDWARTKLAIWEAEAAKALTENGLAATAGHEGDTAPDTHTSHHVLDEARTEMAELLKDNEALEALRAEKGMAHLKHQ